MRFFQIMLLVTFSVLLATCGGGDDTADAGLKGAIEIRGGWIGDLPASAIPKAALFECPFTMPPDETAVGAIEGDQVRIVFDGVPPGTWCVLAFLDTNEAFKECPMCKKFWQNRDDFLDDRELELVG